MKFIFKWLRQGAICVSYWFYPPLCLGCREVSVKQAVCDMCSRTLILDEPTSYDLEQSQGKWSYCFLDETFLSSLMSYYKTHSQPKVAQLLAAWLVVQFFRLDWNFPDVIVPYSQTYWSYFIQGKRCLYRFVVACSALLGVKYVSNFRLRDHNRFSFLRSRRDEKIKRVLLIGLQSSLKEVETEVAYILKKWTDVDVKVLLLCYQHTP